jgi:hypothetical protein
MTQYHKFLKSWTTERGITSFLGSDKPEFQQDWKEEKNPTVRFGQTIIAKPKMEIVTEPMEIAEPTVSEKKTGLKIFKKVKNLPDELQIVIKDFTVAKYTPKQIQQFKDIYEKLWSYYDPMRYIYGLLETGTFQKQLYEGGYDKPINRLKDRFLDRKNDIEELMSKIKKEIKYTGYTGDKERNKKIDYEKLDDGMYEFYLKKWGLTKKDDGTYELSYKIETNSRLVEINKFVEDSTKKINELIKLKM